MTDRSALMARAGGASDPAALRPEPLPARDSWWVPALMVLAGLLAYANSFPGAFFFDDDAAIVQNTSIRALGNLRQVLWPPVEAGIGGRPFANLTFALNYAIGGNNPAGYHAVNLLIHVAAGLLLFGVVRRTLALPSLRTAFSAVASPLAAVAALLWMLHPLQANIVDYMSQRTEGLMGALYLLTFYAFVRSVDEPGPRWSVMAFVACMLGMATKEGMVTAPVMLVLYDRTFVSGGFREALRRHGRTHAAIAATWLLLAGLMLTSKLSERGVGFGLGQSGFDYALTECRSVVRYLQLSFWPAPLVFDYGPNYLHHLSEAWPSGIVLLAVLGATVVALWRAPAVGFLGAWFFVLLAPSSSVIPVVQQPCAENRVYLPLVGAMVLLATLGYRALGRPALRGFAVAAVALGIATWARNPAFQSEIAIWQDTAAKRPENARAANNLGNALLKVGRADEAMPHFETAIRLLPNYADAHNNRGVVLLQRKRAAEALTEFQLAVSQKERYGDAYYNVGEALLQLGRPSEAIAVLRTSLEINPANPKARNNLGIALLDTGHVEESIAEERTAIALSPDMPEAHYNLGNALARAGQVTEALQEFDRALQLNPKFARAQNNAGVILLHQGRKDEAAERFEAALRIDPTYPEAQKNLAIVRPR